MTTEDIQDEIERTRGEMATTLSAIERKLSPRQIMDQAVDTMRELASDRSRVGNVVRENPLPLALIGLGIGWLAVSGAMSRRSGAAEESYESMEGVGGWSGTEGAAGSGYTTGAEAAGYGTAGSAEYAAAARAAGGNGQRVRAGQLAEAAGEKLSRATSGARERVSQWGSAARSTAGEAADRTWDAYQQHPLTMGFVAALIGAAFGALVPTSRRERELMEGSAEGLISRAKETGSEAMDKAARVAERAVQAAKEETRQAFREETPATTTTTTGPSTMTH